MEGAAAGALVTVGRGAAAEGTDPLPAEGRDDGAAAAPAFAAAAGSVALPVAVASGAAAEAWLDGSSATGGVEGVEIGGADGER